MDLVVVEAGCFFETPEGDAWTFALHDPALARSSVEHVINQWIELGQAMLELDWRSERPEVVVAGGTFGQLGVQLMLMVGRAQELMICDGCILPYLRRKRMPRRDQRNYCDTCAEEGIDARDRKRASKPPEKMQEGV